MNARLGVAVATTITVMTISTLGGCSTSRSIEASDSTTTSSAPATNEVPDTTAPVVVDTTAPATSAPPTTEPAVDTTPETSVVSGDGELVLEADGLGVTSFGDTESDVLAALTASLGDPTSSNDELFPNPPTVGSEGFESEGGDFLFVAPFARQYCFAAGLCVVLGGTSAADLTLRGWWYFEPSGEPLATVEGITVGSTWADFEATMNVAEGGCYSVGGGTSDGGVLLTLVSAGDPFGYFTDDGTYIAQLPNPNDVTVNDMTAGDRIAFLFADC